jgi:hypothetical protein
MKDNSQSNYSPLPSEGKRASRFFVDDLTVGWKHIGKDRWSDIRNGRERVSKWAGKTYRTAMAIVELNGRKVVALNHLEIANWKIKQNGLVDLDEQMNRSAIYANIGDKPADHYKTIPMEEDIEAIKRCLGLR